MAKRARGTTRPGQRRPIQRAARPVPGRPPVAPAEASSTGEASRAPAFEAEPFASRHAEPAAAGRRPEPEPAHGTDAPTASQRRPGISGRLAVEAAEEYRYVARDVRRIALIGGSMFGILAGLYVLLELVGVGRH